MRINKLYLIIFSFFILSQSSIATDLKPGDIIRPGQFVYVDDPFAVQFEVENDSNFAADNFQAIVSIFDSNNEKIFEDFVNGSNLQPYDKTVLTTQQLFTPPFPGEFILDIIIEFSQEVTPSNNQKQFAFTAVELPGIKLGPNSGLQISQIDFLFPEFEQPNSSTGLFSADFLAIEEVTQMQFGFINLFSPDLGWVIQNMIFDVSSGYPGLSGMFDLQVEVEIQSLQLCGLLSEEPLLEPIDLIEFDDFPITQVEYNAQGRNMPIGNILAPIPFDNIPFDENGKNDLVWQHGHVNLEQDQNQCGPGALANSLQWLENVDGINVPHEHKPGIRDNSLVGEIDKASNRAAHQTVSDANMLNGKIKYIDDNNLNGSLSIKHKNRSGQSFIPNNDVTVGNTTSKANTSNTSLIDWIISELKDGEDVELAIGWSGGGGHWVDLIGGGYVDGVPWLAWVHDTKQGFDDMGTASTADDTTKANGGLDPASGGYGWSYVINNQLAALFGSDTSRGTIDLALSESKKPSPDLKFGDIIFPPKVFLLGEPFNFEFEIQNISSNPADEFDIEIVALDLVSAQPVFVEKLENVSLAGDSNTTIISQEQFDPQSTGEFLLQIEIIDQNDSDSSNNKIEFPFFITDTPAEQLGPEDGLFIFQVDFTLPEFEELNSSTGLISVDFNTIESATGMSFGFLNVFSPDLGWIIQNMIIDQSSGYPGLSGMINLQLPEPIEIVELELSPLIFEEPLLDPIPLEQLTFETFEVSTVEYNAQGRNMPIGNILAPIPFENIPFDSTGKNDLVWQHGHVNLEQDQNQCGPGALANSLQWLENVDGINVPHEHKPGIRDTSLVGEIDKATQRQPHQTVSDVNMLNGKLKYIDDNNLTNSLKVKHKNRQGQSFVPNNNVTVGSTTSNANTTNTTLIDWIIQELKDGEDVELGIGWSGGGGHWVDLIGGGYVEGVPWIAWVHDTKQGFDDMGTASTADDTTKANGGLDPKSGGYGYSYVINNQLAMLFGSDTSRGTIDLALSESKDTNNVTSVSENELKELPTEFALEQNYPNPFNPSTIIKYSVPQAGRVTIKLYDSIGKLVKVLTTGYKEVGVYEIEFRADNLSSGVYIYTMEAGSFVQSKKMIMLK